MFNPGILIGDVITEADVHRIFECQTQKGIRLSLKNHAIIIVSDATPSNPYADDWDGDVLYYTGTDACAIDGNQTLSGPGNNNGALKDVWDAPEKTTIFLFVKYAPNQCTYKGVVRLVREPYQETRKSNPNQTVWKFPLRLVDVSMETLQKDYAAIESRAALKSEKELKKAAMKRQKNPNRGKPVKRTVTAATYDRDLEIKAYVKARAHGKCDFCEGEAPFVDESGHPYLEAHHIEWLARGGADIPANMVALCPNCHRKMHILDLEEDISVLKAKAERYSLQGK